MKRFSILAFLLISTAAGATPRALPFTYPYATLPKGGLELEEYIDLTPVPGAESLTPRAVMTTELEFGISDRLELGLYLLLSNDPGSGAGDAPLRYEGIKQRLRVRLAEAGQWPIDVGLYGELAELRDEFEIEAKLLLEKQVGRWRFMSNFWVEYEIGYAGGSEWILNPTAGTTVEITPALHLGLEYWLRGEFGGGEPPGTFNPSNHHFLGPTVLLQWDKFWWSTGAYVRLENLGRDSQMGDEVGKIWIRTMVGIGL